MWWIVALLSAGLIGVGVVLIARDIRRGLAAKRTHAKPQSGPVAVTGTAAPMPHWPGLTPPNTSANPTNSTYDQPTADDDEPVPGPSAPRDPAVETQWLRLKPEVAAAITAINQQLGPLAVDIGSAGAPSWSVHNRGYGDYRRVRIDGNSIAWLRLEAAAHGGMTARLRAHDPEIKVINGASAAPPRCAADDLQRMLLESLATTTQYAHWRQTNGPRTAASNGTPKTVTGIASVPATAPLPTAAVPPSAAALADAAITLVNSAFAEAGARLMPLRANQWPGAAGREARVLAIDANGALAGTMLVDPQADRIDIAVTAGRSATASAAKRQSLPIAGLSVHTLAETVATSAWPAIAAVLRPS